MEKQQYLHFHKNLDDEIIINVDKTLLTWCIPLSIKNSLWNTVSDKSIDQLKKQYDIRMKYGKRFAEETYINIRLVDINGNIIVESKETVIYQKKNGAEYIRINLSKISLELQKIFWFTTMVTIMNTNVNGDAVLKFTSDMFIEKVKITPIIDPVNAEKTGLLIKPVTIVSHDISCTGIKSDEVANLLKIAHDFMKYNTYRLTRKQNNIEKHTNKIISAGQWKDAAEFKGIDTAMKNCIYYLASEPKEGEPANLYIGEAECSGRRLVTRKIDGKTYIGHSERKSDFSIYRFSKYRFDQISTLEAMHNAQDALIGAFNMSDHEVFQNGFKLTNKAFNKAHSEANKTKKNKRLFNR